jgi:hypothetical protein
VAWTLNIRGYDNPNSPVPNSRLIIGRNKKVYLIAEKKKVSRIISNGKIRKKNIINPKKFSNLIYSLKGNKFIIDSISCSVLNENIIKSKFQIINRNDPCYNLKSIKNSNEINLMEKAHIEDGVALTKFIYWMKNKKKINLSEIDAQK